MKFQSIAACVFVSSLLSSALTGTLAAQEETPFLRGDVNLSGVVDISDPVSVLFGLFRADFDLLCEKAADFDDSGTLDVTDAIVGLAYLFQEGPPPAEPFPGCGFDPSSDTLTCDESPCDVGASNIVINEILTSNLDGLQDEDDDRPDWIELHLPNSAVDESVDLGGWYLTDDADLLTGWQFPANTVLQRGEFLVIFASGKDRAVTGEELHTDFRLDSDGEYVGLIGPDGITIVDEFAPIYPEQLADISWGRSQSITTLVAADDSAHYLVPTETEDGLGSSWTEPGFSTAGWDVGQSGFGFSETASVDGFEVTMYQANITVNSLSTADSVRTNPARQTRVVTRNAEFIDYFNSGGRGNFANDRAFPGLTFSDVDNFVVAVTGTVLIPSAGAWTFGVNSDDGFGLVLQRGASSYETSFELPRGPADTLQTFNIAEAGAHDVELLYYEQGGGAHLELFAAQGSHGSFNGNFRLVGDTDNGGLGLAGFAADVGTDVGDDMIGQNASFWARWEFDVADRFAFGGLVLSMMYEDGFVAYLNGVEVARRNAPANLAWLSTATTDRDLQLASIAEEINLSDHLGELQNGTNVLAIHGLNDSAIDFDFLIQPELIGAGRGTEMQYLTTPTPGAFNVSGAVDFVRSVEFSVEHGFFDSSFNLALSTSTPGAQIRWTSDGSTPSPTNGSVYSSPLPIDETTVVRAAAFKTDHLDSRVTTQSYFFVEDIKAQSPTGARPGPGWPSGDVNGQVMHYGMDPNVVNSAPWSSQIEDALLAIPSISLVTDLPNLFSSSTGIYVNARNSGRAWERPTSVELLDPEGGATFTENAGLRIRGAFSRSGGNPKHSFRLFFRREYGAGKLRFPLFGGEGVDEFDSVDLRTSQNYSWAFSGDRKNTFIRDVFSRDAQRDMGQPFTRSRYYHLYLNGVYWGLYMTEERADADFAASYLKGDEDDYDVVKNDSSGSRALHATDGNMTAYRALYDAAVAGFTSNIAYLVVQGLDPRGDPDPNRDALLDADNLIDYMVCTYYTGDPDAPISAWAHFSNNVFAIYNRERPDGFKWFRHDAEHSLGANGGLNEARLLTDSTDRSIGQEWRHFNPAWLHLRLTANAEYRLRFADRVNELFHTRDVFSASGNIARWSQRADRIRQAVIGASARWGDSQREPARTQNDWQAESDWMVNTYFPQRTAIVLAQMRSVNMFPSTALVSFNQNGGEVPAGFRVTLSQSNGTSGTIYHTVSGADPRDWGGAISGEARVYSAATPLFINETTTVKARVRSGTTWGALTEARFTVGLEGLVINEVLASNQTILEDPNEPGEYPDWVELYNGTDAAIDLSGMYLSDDPSELDKWQIADGISIESGEHLLFIADDDGTQGPFHTSYQLSSSGETILLVDADGKTVLDSIVFGEQFEDVSYGRFPDGGDTWDYHQEATPYAANGPHIP